MEVLFLTDSFAPHAGGTAVVFHEWCKRLSPTPVTVVTRSYPGQRQVDQGAPFRALRVPFLNIPKLRMPWMWLLIFLRALVWLLFRRRRAVVIHAGQILETGLAAHLLSRLFGVPYVVHTFAEELNHYAKRNWTRALMVKILASASAVSTISQYSLRRLEQLELYRGRPFLVYPGVDLQAFLPQDRLQARRRLGLPEQAPVLLTVARMMRRKGHDLVLRALPDLLRHHPDLKYVVVGTGLEHQRLQKMTAELGLGNTVVFAGRAPLGELCTYYSAADLFVHPNREVQGDVEGFGMVFLEAGACEIPVIGGNSGGTPDAIDHEQTGYLVDPERPQEMTSRILELLARPADRQRLGRNGRRWAARFNWEQAVEVVQAMNRSALP